MILRHDGFDDERLERAYRLWEARENGAQLVYALCAFTVALLFVAVNHLWSGSADLTLIWAITGAASALALNIWLNVQLFTTTITSSASNTISKSVANSSTPTSFATHLSEPSTTLRSSISVAVALWLISVPVSLGIGGSGRDTLGVALTPALIAVFFAYALLPSQRLLYSAAVAFAVTVAQVIVSAWKMSNNAFQQFAADRLAAAMLAHAWTHFVGAYAYRARVRLARAAFLNARNAVASRRDLRVQSAMMRALLSGTLPPHIRGAVQRQFTDRRQPPNVYVESHTQISVVYAKLYGLQAVLDHVSVQDAARLINELDWRVDGLAACHRLVRVQSDAIVVVGGLSNGSCVGNNDDHAVRACRFANDLSTILRSFCEATGSNVRTRAGVGSGAAAAGIVGAQKWHYEVIGVPLESAQRLEAAAPIGVTLLSDSANHLVERHFITERADASSFRLLHAVSDAKSDIRAPSATWLNALTFRVCAANRRFSTLDVAQSVNQLLQTATMAVTTTATEGGDDATSGGGSLQRFNAAIAIALSGENGISSGGGNGGTGRRNAGRRRAGKRKTISTTAVGSPIANNNKPIDNKNINFDEFEVNVEFRHLLADSSALLVAEPLADEWTKANEEDEDARALAMDAWTLRFGDASLERAFHASPNDRWLVPALAFDLAFLIVYAIYQILVTVSPLSVALDADGTFAGTTDYATARQLAAASLVVSLALIGLTSALLSALLVTLYSDCFPSFRQFLTRTAGGHSLLILLIIVALFVCGVVNTFSCPTTVASGVAAEQQPTIHQDDGSANSMAYAFVGVTRPDDTSPLTVLCGGAAPHYAIVSVALWLLASAAFLRFGTIQLCAAFGVGLAVLAAFLLGTHRRAYDPIVAADALCAVGALAAAVAVWSRRNERLIRADFLCVVKTLDACDRLERVECVNAQLTLDALPTHLARRHLAATAGSSTAAGDAAAASAYQHQWPCVGVLCARFADDDRAASETWRGTFGVERLQRLVYDVDQLLGAEGSLYSGIVEKVRHSAATYTAAVGVLPESAGSGRGRYAATHLHQETPPLTISEQLALLAQFAAALRHKAEAEGIRVAIGMDCGTALSLVVGAGRGRPRYELVGAVHDRAHKLMAAAATADDVAVISGRRPKANLQQRGSGSTILVSEEIFLALRPRLADANRWRTVDGWTPLRIDERVTVTVAPGLTGYRMEIVERHSMAAVLPAVPDAEHSAAVFSTLSTTAATVAATANSPKKSPYHDAHSFRGVNSSGSPHFFNSYQAVSKFQEVNNNSPRMDNNTSNALASAHPKRSSFTVVPLTNRRSVHLVDVDGAIVAVDVDDGTAAATDAAVATPTAIASSMASSAASTADIFALGGGGETTTDFDEISDGVDECICCNNNSKNNITNKINKIVNGVGYDNFRGFDGQDAVEEDVIDSYVINNIISNNNNDCKSNMSPWQLLMSHSNQQKQQQQNEGQCLEQQQQQRSNALEHLFTTSMDSSIMSYEECGKDVMEAEGTGPGQRRSLDMTSEDDDNNYYVEEDDVLSVDVGVESDSEIEWIAASATRLASRSGWTRPNLETGGGVASPLVSRNACRPPRPPSAASSIASRYRRQLSRNGPRLPSSWMRFGGRRSVASGSRAASSAASNASSLLSSVWSLGGGAAAERSNASALERLNAAARRVDKMIQELASVDTNRTGGGNRPPTCQNAGFAAFPLGSSLDAASMDSPSLGVHINDGHQQPSGRPTSNNNNNNNLKQQKPSSLGREASSAAHTEYDNADSEWEDRPGIGNEDDDGLSNNNNNNNHNGYYGVSGYSNDANNNKNDDKPARLERKLRALLNGASLRHAGTAAPPPPAPNNRHRSMRRRPLDAGNDADIDSNCSSLAASRQRLNDGNAVDRCGRFPRGIDRKVAVPREQWRQSLHSIGYENEYELKAASSDAEEDLSETDDYEFGGSVTRNGARCDGCGNTDVIFGQNDIGKNCSAVDQVSQNSSGSGSAANGLAALNGAHLNATFQLAHLAFADEDDSDADDAPSLDNIRRGIAAAASVAATAEERILDARGQLGVLSRQICRNFGHVRLTGFSDDGESKV